jgi:hypothetical protein
MCKTYCAWDTSVARRLKILMYLMYTPVFRRLASWSPGARSGFTTISQGSAGLRARSYFIPDAGIFLLFPLSSG